MARHISLPVTDGQLNQPLSQLVAELLEKGVVDAVLVPAKQPHSASVMQTLICDPKEAETVDPLAPVAPTSSAPLVAKLTRNADHKVAAFLKPCEVKAFIELVKLKQGSLDPVLLIGMDCHGRYENTDFIQYASNRDNPTLEFLKSRGNTKEATNDLDIVSACKACETPVAENVDLRLLTIGLDAEKTLLIEAVSPLGEKALDALSMEPSEKPVGRQQAVDELMALRAAYSQTSRTEMLERVSSIDGLMDVISTCINCYNCRVACPVCYCRECVFATDTFSHDSRQYVKWAEKRGRLRMPTDTLFYHLTRMAHMSTLCVACGQCTSACPMDIPVGDLFRAVADGAQAVFDYIPGRNPDEAQPLASFVEHELPDVTGQTK